MSPPCGNYIDGVACASVVRKCSPDPREPFFYWLDNEGWKQGDDIPADLFATLPLRERFILERHAINRRELRKLAGHAVP